MTNKKIIKNKIFLKNYENLDTKKILHTNL